MFLIALHRNSDIFVDPDPLFNFFGTGKKAKNRSDQQVNKVNNQQQALGSSLVNNTQTASVTV